MSRNPLRKDKTCLNCKHVVENRFCPNCGQENSDTRKTFQHLFIHFFEDLTHYENAFWRTIKNLLFRPSSLTKEYLSGKRLSYLAPVRLYIFISFITFFLIAIVPKTEDGFIKIKQVKPNTKKDNFRIYSDDKKNSEIKELLKSEYIPKKVRDSIQKKSDKNDEDNNSEVGFMDYGYKSIEQIDSIQKYAPADEKMTPLEYWLNKKLQHVKDNNTKDETIEKLLESAKHNFPKVLLIYMPIFAFFLWVFHNKKRWYYFDHGIFTLHYFSFLLLLFLVVFLSSSLLDMLIENRLINFIKKSIEIIGTFWMFYYFFPAHHRFYGETRWVSFMKSFALFIINMFFIAILLTLFFLYTLINIH